MILQLRTRNLLTRKRIKQLKREHLKILEKENKAIKDITLRDIRNLFENEEEKNYYKLVNVSNFWSNNYIEDKSYSDRYKILSVEKYLDKIRPYLRETS